MENSTVYNFRLAALIAQIGIFIMLTTGCAGIEQRHYEIARERALANLDELNDITVCCSDFSQLEYLSLTDERTLFSFGGDDSDVYNFESGPSYFAAIEISSSLPRQNIFIRSILWRPSRDQSEVLVVPSLLALDRDHQVVESVDIVPLCFHAGWSEVGYYGSITVTPERIRYLVLYTKPEVVAGGTRYQRSATAAGGGVISTVNVDRVMPNSPSGDIELWRGINPEAFPSKRCSAINNVTLGKAGNG